MNAKKELLATFISKYTKLLAATWLIFSEKRPEIGEFKSQYCPRAVLVLLTLS